MQAKLIPVGGGPTIPILNDVTVVGRKRGLCDLVVERGSVSKLHCLIVKTDGLLFIRDLGSTNGTKVNGQRVTRGALLPGDELAFASARFRVHMGPGEPEPAYDDRTEMISAWPRGDRPEREPAVSDAEMEGSENGDFLPEADFVEEDEQPSQLKSVPEQLQSLPAEQLESIPEEEFLAEVAGGDSESDVRLLSDDSIG
ncbi:MAG TPA: FHA domain-containing protein [Planctomycetaceae bacterium]|nr:FHA domain-containing protein [Planctomycetaceae bacterium]